MLSALSNFFGKKQTNEQQIVKIEKQIKDIEVRIDPKSRHLKDKSLEWHCD